MTGWLDRSAPREALGPGQPLRILVVIPTYLPAVRFGGPIVAAHGLSRALADVGHDVQVLTTDADVDGRLAVPVDTPVVRDGVTINYFPYRSHFAGLGRRLYVAPRLAEAATRLLPHADIVHLHSVFLWPTLRVARLAAKAGKPYVVTPHGMLDDVLIKARGRVRKRLWIALFERRTLQEAAAIHATSELEVQQLEQMGFGPPALRRVANGLDADLTASPAEPAAARRAGEVLCLGRLNWKKGCEVLLDAIARLPAATLTFAGTGEAHYVESLKRRAMNLGIGTRVRFEGQVGPDARRALLDRAQCLALPSRSENFALVVAEAMVRRCPVVVSEAVGLATAVRDAGAGFVVPDGAPALETALRQVLAGPAAAAEMGRRGRRYALEHFSWERVVPQMESLYRDAMAAAYPARSRGQRSC
ncbi:MAG: glycosyltransferase [Pseudomonadota bacterium]